MNRGLVSLKYRRNSAATCAGTGASQGRAGFGHLLWQRDNNLILSKMDGVVESQASEGPSPHRHELKLATMVPSRRRLAAINSVVAASACKVANLMPASSST